ncbi:MAG: hypothetical protein E6Q97_04410 [Desulfurellales bacterium]|nr:MAG: hypothetical protein E6Q97_04410 [Desulfurellales bacterium]
MSRLNVEVGFQTGEKVLYVTAINTVVRGVVVGEFKDEYGDWRTEVKYRAATGVWVSASPTSDRVGRVD